ncbi:hypothetical protein ABMA27_007635 [Loxostege sticticalis]|uniref:Transposase n=1 Tax=Loxostege sticticalis TaxID=481309 RepID=A0ABR3HG72_LOXSC
MVFRCESRMVRQYEKKSICARNGKTFKPYQSYSKENLESAIKDVKSKKLSLREAALKYDVPKSTIERHSKGQTTYESAGHPTLFSREEENKFIQYIQVVAEWGFPFDLIDLRVFAQRYLNRIGRKVYTLQDNLPGRDWAANFLIRHKSVLSNRISSNISSDRAKVNEEVIDEFFDNYEETIQGIEPDCIVNYDETNLTDDPGSNKFIFRRGTKYPEKVMNSSKTAISLMFSGTADGTLLPVYTVYKSEHKYDTWVLGGPETAHYNNSRSGWFDSICFEDWFNSIIIPFAKSKHGKQVLIIGDNLSSHFSENVLKSCQKYNIKFACLPPKATHLMQPLDVAYYAPLKHYWRQILTDWKKKEGRKQKTLSKNAFPGLLQKLLNRLEDSGSSSQNLISGFEKTGLYPVNRDRPKTRLPKTQHSISEINENASAVVVEMLEELRGTQSDAPKRRKKRCNVPAGKSITVSDVLQKENDDLLKKKKGKGKGQGKRTKTVDKTDKENENDDLVKKKKEKGKGQGKQTKVVDITDKENENTSENTQNPKKKKSKPLQGRKNYNSDTSNSDIEMSVHADSDIFDVANEMSDSLTEYDMYIPEIPYSQRRLIDASPSPSESVRTEGNNLLSTTASTKNIEYISDASANKEFLPADLLKDISAGPEENLSIPKDISTLPENELPPARISTSPPAVSSPITIVEVASSAPDNGLSPLEVPTLPIENAKDVLKLPGNELSLPAAPVISMEQTDDVSTAPKKRKVQQKNKNNPKKSKSDNKKQYKIKTTEAVPPTSETNLPPTSSLEYAKLKNIHVAETETPGCSNQEKEIPVNYNMNDYVIVRYILKKKVEYFVGKIIEIRQGKVKISFFNKVGKYDSTIFRKPKKKDIDTVDDSMIVRSVELMAINESETDFVFHNDDDYFYFDY